MREERRSSFCFVAMCVLALGWSGAAQARGQNGKAAVAPDPLADLQAGNVAVRAAYRAARTRAVAESGPIVLFDGDDLVFRYGKVRRASQPTPAVYQDLKVVGHMVMGLDLLLASDGDGEVRAPRLVELKEFREALEKVRAAIRQRHGLTKKQQERQAKILEACDTYLTHVIDNARVRHNDLRAVLWKVVPLLEENAREAARAEIDGLHREMQGYRARLSDAEWKNLRVIVEGSQQGRKGHLAVQYFARLLGEPGEGRRIIYAEAIFDEEKALALLGIKDLDARVGQDFWGEPSRLYGDLLGPAARGYLDELFGKK